MASAQIEMTDPDGNLCNVRVQGAASDDAIKRAQKGDIRDALVAKRKTLTSAVVAKMQSRGWKLGGKPKKPAKAAKKKEEPTKAPDKPQGDSQTASDSTAN